MDGDAHTGPDREKEPDYRFTLANERTFLAWLRTSLAMLASAVAVDQLVPRFSVPGAKTAVAVYLAVLSLVTSGVGVHRWQQVQKAMRLNQPLPASRNPWVLAGALMLLACIACGLLVAQGVA